MRFSISKQAPGERKPGVSVSIPKTQVFTELTNGKPYIVRRWESIFVFLFVVLLWLT